MYIINGKYALCPDKRAIIELKGTYEEDKVKSEIDRYLGEVNTVTPRNEKEYNGLMPMSLYIFPTSDCNLRCKYCFSDAGEVRRCHLSRTQIDSALMMSSKTAFLVSKTAKSLGRKGAPLEVWFAGGGEPTFDWDTFVYAVERAKALSAEYRFDIKFGILTNGNGYNAEKTEYIIKNFSFVQVSIDGTEEIQNIQRPAFDGSNSFLPADTFIKDIMVAGVKFGLRSTVSSVSVNKLAEITEFFAVNYPKTEYIGLEPLSLTDRSSRNNFTAPDAKSFVENFQKALIVGRKHRIIVATSMLNISQVRDRDSFCGSTSGDCCVVQPNGYMTGCTHTMPESIDSVYRPFMLGKINENGTVEKYEDILQSVVTLDDKCRKCDFISFCQGDCPIIRFNSKEGLNYRCAIRKLLIKDFLMNMVNDTDAYIMRYKKIKCDSPYINSICFWDDTVMGYMRRNFKNA